jgi:hypothetical protein
MSRIGKKPIPIPKGVTVKIDGAAVDVKGPKGQMRQALPPGVVVAVEDGQILARRERDEKALAKFHGLARSLVANAVQGVTEGWKRELDIVGVGYRAELKGKQVHFARGRKADPPDGDRRRPSAGWPGGGEHAPAAQARPVPAEGRALHRRSAEEEGRKDGGVAP